MALNPFAEKGRPLEKQWEPIRQLVKDPYDKDSVDEYTRLRVIDAYGMENEQWHFYHQLARHLVRTKPAISFPVGMAFDGRNNLKEY